jgi:4'-phosphopantetheinyl transferase EntD
LFDDEVATAEVDLIAASELHDLYPEERSDLPRAVDRREREYRAGRHCARAALAKLGVHGVAVRRGEDRTPVWPPGYVGSITHTQRGDVGFCGAVAAPLRVLRSIGIDAETDDALGPDLFRRILTPREIATLSAELDPGRTAKLAFSAKEAFYKCQYPLSRQFLEFGDVEIDFDLQRNRFSAILLRVAGPFVAGTAFEGRLVQRNGLFLTAVRIKAD